MRATLSFLILLNASALLACGSDSSSSSTDGGKSCNGGQTRCSGNEYQECKSSTFTTTSQCAGATVCSISSGCVECDPDVGGVCDGDAIYACNADGTKAGLKQQCEAGQCSNGRCETGASKTCTASGTQLIYVIDTAQNLLSFDPNKLGSSDPFTLIGRPSCPASGAIDGLGTATPFSMSVDRNGTAWVLYSSGELFHVSTSNATCQSTNWRTGNGGFELFGMGFVTNEKGSNEETLYIAGGKAGNLVDGNLGTISSTMQVKKLGALPKADRSAELTGTGDAKLYAYFPGTTSPSLVANLDKTTIAKGDSWAMPALPGGATAWAFAHYGGKFYIFATSGNRFSETNNVYELDSSTGKTTTVVPNSQYKIVGAGVSTCVPITID